MPQSFRCDSCAAPLEFEGNNSSFQRCDFCGNQVIVPNEVRNAFDSQFNFGGNLISQARKLKEIKQIALSGNQILAIKLYRENFGCGLKEAKEAVESILAGRPIVFTGIQSLEGANADMNNVVAQAMKIAEVQSEISAGRKLNAIKIFRETTGCGLQEAKDAVEAMERGEAVNLTNFENRQTLVNIQTEKQDAMSNSSVMWFPLKLMALFIAIGLGAAAIIYAVTGFKTVKPVFTAPVVSNTSNVNSKPQYATTAVKFGGEGVGAGQFDDNRAIAIDGEGRIYVANYSEGRVQAFDGNGKFLTQWTVEGDYIYISNLAADRAGKVFVPLAREIRIYDGASGKESGKIPAIKESFNNIAVALDGTLWVTTNNGNVLHLSNDGKQILFTIKNAGKLAGLKQNHIDQIAVDGANNVYVFDTNDYYILKFNAKGEFLNRFGGKPDKFTKETPPGKLSNSINGLAVDNKGRVYASEVSRIVVFDAQGGFLGDFETTQTFGIAFNDKNELWSATRPFVTKFVINEK